MILVSCQLFFCLFFYFIPFLSSGADTLVVNQSLSGDQTLVSRAGIFELGFFKPGESLNYYIGIWYKNIPSTIVWVANRETPISDRFSSKLKIFDSNLVLLDESKTQIWSTNVMISTSSTSVSVLLHDDGSLVLRNGTSSNPPIWQSFDHPTHTFLPGSKIGYDKRTHRGEVLTSWKSREDPAVGLFSLEIDPNASQWVLRWNKSVQYWNTGPWNGRIFSLIPEMRLNYINNFSYINNENEIYFSYYLYDPSTISRFILDVSGQLQQQTLLESQQQWNLFWAQPRSRCEIYAVCGAFATCDGNVIPSCTCLTAFKPRSESDWNLSDSSGGCVRKTKLDCTVKAEKLGFITSYVSPIFLSLIPENGMVLSDESVCRRSCLDDCSCDAYSFISKTCRQWNSENLSNISLVFVSVDANRNNVPLSIKVSSSDLATNPAKINTKVLVAGIVSGFFSLVFLCSIGIRFYKKRVKRRGRRDKNRGILELQFGDNEAHVRYLVDPGALRLSAQDRKGIVVPFFGFRTISSATQNFSLANKLGQGGFGPVYKGMLPGGTEIAV